MDAVNKLELNLTLQPDPNAWAVSLLEVWTNKSGHKHQDNSLLWKTRRWIVANLFYTIYFRVILVEHAITEFQRGVLLTEIKERERVLCCTREQKWYYGQWCIMLWEKGWLHTRFEYWCWGWRSYHASTYHHKHLWATRWLQEWLLILSRWPRCERFCQVSNQCIFVTHGFMSLGETHFVFRYI